MFTFYEQMIIVWKVFESKHLLSPELTNQMSNPLSRQWVRPVSGTAWLHLPHRAKYTYQYLPKRVALKSDTSRGVWVQLERCNQHQFASNGLKLMEMPEYGYRWRHSVIKPGERSKGSNSGQQVPVWLGNASSSDLNTLWFIEEQNWRYVV